MGANDVLWVDTEAAPDIEQKTDADPLGEDVAELLDTTQQQYSKYENGYNEIPVRHVITLCKFYKISSDWLLGLKDTME